MLEGTLIEAKVSNHDIMLVLVRRPDRNEGLAYTSDPAIIDRVMAMPRGSKISLTGRFSQSNFLFIETVNAA